MGIKVDRGIRWLPQAVLQLIIYLGVDRSILSLSLPVPHLSTIEDHLGSLHFKLEVHLSQT